MWITTGWRLQLADFAMWQVELLVHWSGVEYHTLANSIRPVISLTGGGDMPKLNFSGNLPNTIRNNILKLPVIPAGAFSFIQMTSKMATEILKPACTEHNFMI